MVPRVGVSNAPARYRNVLLPLPEGPMIATASPGASDKSTPSSTGTGPAAVSYCFETFSALSNGSPLGDGLIDRRRTRSHFRHGVVRAYTIGCVLAQRSKPVAIGRE